MTLSAPTPTTYHRIASSTQDLDTMVKQLATGTVWGQQVVNVGAFPCVKAYFGPLPLGVDGVEFETVRQPDPHRNQVGSDVFWYECNGQSDPVPGRFGFCQIDVTIRRVRYVTTANLQSGADWP